jgi:transcriptional regulator with XRE-family HTH domain
MTTPTDQHEILRVLGERIADLRRRAGLTQEQLSELADVDVQAIQRAEAGRSALALERLAKVAVALGVGLPDLFAFDAPAVAVPGWSADEAQVVAAFRAVPDDRRALVVPLLGVLGRR